MAFTTEQLAGIRTGRSQEGHPKDGSYSSQDAEGDFQEVFMGCTIYAASPKALPADEARGQDRYYQLPHCSHAYGNCSQRIAAYRASYAQLDRLHSVNGLTVPGVEWSFSERKEKISAAMSSSKY